MFDAGRNYLIHFTLTFYWGIHDRHNGIMELTQIYPRLFLTEKSNRARIWRVRSVVAFLPRATLRCPKCFCSPLLFGEPYGAGFVGMLSQQSCHDFCCTYLIGLDCIFAIVTYSVACMDRYIWISMPSDSQERLMASLGVHTQNACLKSH